MKKVIKLAPIFIGAANIVLAGCQGKVKRDGMLDPVIYQSGGMLDRVIYQSDGMLDPMIDHPAMFPNETRPIDNGDNATEEKTAPSLFTPEEAKQWTLLDTTLSFDPSLKTLEEKLALMFPEGRPYFWASTRSVFSFGENAIIHLYGESHNICNPEVVRKIEALSNEPDTFLFLELGMPKTNDLMGWTSMLIDGLSLNTFNILSKEISKLTDYGQPFKKIVPIDEFRRKNDEGMATYLTYFGWDEEDKVETDVRNTLQVGDLQTAKRDLGKIYANFEKTYREKASEDKLLKTKIFKEARKEVQETYEQAIYLLQLMHESMTEKHANTVQEELVATHIKNEEKLAQVAGRYPEFDAERFELVCETVGQVTVLMCDVFALHTFFKKKRSFHAQQAKNGEKKSRFQAVWLVGADHAINLSEKFTRMKKAKRVV